MIKLQSLLNEARWEGFQNVEGGRRTKSITNQKAGQVILNRKAIEAVHASERGCRIFRGIPLDRKEYDISTDKMPPYRFVRPSKTYRMAKNTFNFVNAVLDVIPSWKNWPKRSRSIVGSNTPSRAAGYGHTYQVFPFDGAKIGISSEPDFWMSFSILNDRLGLDVASFNNRIGDVFSAMGIYEDLDHFFPEDAKKLFQKIDELLSQENYLNNVPTARLFDIAILKDMVKHMTDSAEQYFDELLNPEKNGFRLVDIKDYNLSTYPSLEVWTDRDALMIDRNVIPLP